MRDAEWLPERCVRLWSQSEIWLDRIRPTPKQINIRPYLNDLRCENQSLRIDLWLSQEGSARADEVVRALGLQSRLDEGDYLTRTDLILLDEMSPEAIALLPELPTATSRATFERPLVGALPELEPATASSEWGASPNGPVVE